MLAFNKFHRVPQVTTSTPSVGNSFSTTSNQHPIFLEHKERRLTGEADPRYQFSVVKNFSQRPFEETRFGDGVSNNRGHIFVFDNSETITPEERALEELIQPLFDDHCDPGTREKIIDLLVNLALKGNPVNKGLASELLIRLSRDEQLPVPPTARDYLSTAVKSIPDSTNGSHGDDYEDGSARYSKILENGKLLNAESNPIDSSPLKICVSHAPDDFKDVNGEDTTQLFFVGSNNFFKEQQSCINKKSPELYVTTPMGVRTQIKTPLGLYFDKQDETLYQPPRSTSDTPKAIKRTGEKERLHGYETSLVTFRSGPGDDR